MRYVVLGVLAGLCSSAALAQERPLLIRGAQVFDGERSLGVRDVLVRDGLIERVAAKMMPKDGAQIVDGRGKTLLPGFIDAHVHVFPTAAADALRFGVTTEFDMFTFGEPGAAARRKAQRESYAAASEADVWSAGLGVTPPGGHPQPMAKAMGMDLKTLAPGADAAAFVREQVAAGSDYIKIFQDDGTAHGSAASLSAFPRERLGQVIGAVKTADRKSIVHVSKMSDAADAFALGADALAHMWQDKTADDAIVKLAVDRKATVIPTLSVLASASGDPISGALAEDAALKPFLSPMQTGMIAARFPKLRPGTLDKALASVGKLHRAGVPILAGTDAPNPGTAHGTSIHGEMELLVRAGLSAAEALTAATSAPARFFGVADRGRIAEGMRADLVLVDGDPTREIKATRRIVAIWKNGYAVDRGKLAAMPQPPAAN